MSKEERIGSISVDAGCIQIGDPCYTHEEAGNWSDYCKNELSRMDENNKQYTSIGDGIAVVVNSGHGDGGYPVFVTRDPNGLVASVTVRFIEKGKQNEMD